MTKKVFYKVLLVDDNKSLGESLQPLAEQYELDLRQFDCWGDAKEQLLNREDFNQWSAIILDANCVIEKNGVPDLTFLGIALEDLREQFVRRDSPIPWYVLTAGGTGEFEFVKKQIQSKTRDEDWGQVIYFKDKEDENGKDQVEILFENIRKVAPLSERNKIRFRYKNVFDVLDKHFDKQDENLMFDLLTELHFPKGNFNPVIYYNSLRKVVECLFRACNKIGLLPDIFFDDNRRINSVQEASIYLAGKESDHLHVRYGKEGDSVFPRIIGEIVKRILNVTNKHSHTAEIEESEIEEMNAYQQEVKSCNMLFGYTLQLCDVIEWFGNYAKGHSNREVNLEKCVHLGEAYYEGRIDILEQDEENNLHIECCKIPYRNNQDKVGKKIRLIRVEKNTKGPDEFIKKYPYIAMEIELVKE